MTDKKLVREFVELTPVATQIIRIREQFKTLKEDWGIEDLILDVPDLQDNFAVAFKSIADNLDQIINELDAWDYIE